MGGEIRLRDLCARRVCEVLGQSHTNRHSPVCQLPQRAARKGAVSHVHGRIEPMAETMLHRAVTTAERRIRFGL